MIQKWYVQILHISLAMAPSVKEAKDALRHALHTIADDREWRRSDWSEETKLAQFGRSGAKTAALRQALYGGKLQFVCRGKDVEAFGMFKGPESFVIRQGSRISLIKSPKFLDSKPLGYGQRWLEVQREGFVDSQGVVLKDIECTSRAMAASVVLASVKNGNNEWLLCDDKMQQTLGSFFGK